MCRRSSCENKHFLSSKYLTLILILFIHSIKLNWNIFRYNYEGKYLDAQELKDFLEKEQMVGVSFLEAVSVLL